MAAFRAVVADLDGGRLAERALNVEYVLHAVCSRQMVVGSPGQADRQVDRKRRRVEEVCVSNVLWRGISIVRIVRCPASQSAVQIEDGILAFLRIEEPKTSADRPLLRGTPGDAEPRREVIVIGRNQPVTHSTVSGKLQLRGPRSIGTASCGGPIRLVAEIDA